MYKNQETFSFSIDREDFVQRMNEFLEKQPQMDRMIFVLRFWYLKTPKEIAQTFGVADKEIYNRLYLLHQRLSGGMEESGYASCLIKEWNKATQQKNIGKTYNKLFCFQTGQNAFPSVS